jgi:hypothetical protein
VRVLLLVCNGPWNLMTLYGKNAQKRNFTQTLLLGAELIFVICWYLLFVAICYLLIFAICLYLLFVDICWYLLFVDIYLLIFVICWYFLFVGICYLLIFAICWYLRSDGSTDRQTDRHEEADSRLSQFCEIVWWLDIICCCLCHLDNPSCFVQI